MPRKTLKSLLPSASRMRETGSLRLLGEWVYADNLWHINRYSASMAFFVGLFVAFLPIPGQMLVAALLALLFKCNLPLAVALVWLTNPITTPPIYLFAYKVGAILLDVPVGRLNFELSFAWLGDSMAAVWRPLLLGCLLCGLFFGSLGYFVVSQLWRWRVAYNWRQRRRRRAARDAQ